MVQSTVVTVTVREGVPLPTYVLSISSSPEGIPFTINGTEVVTPYSEALEEGTHIVAMPSSIVLDETTYNFKQWTDGSTNPTRTIDLTADASLSATYTTEIPPPPPPPIEMFIWIVLPLCIGVASTIPVD